MAEPERPVALVTGASRGIGYAVAVALARKGWRIVALGRSERALERLDDDVKAAGGEATLVPLDLKDHDAIDRLAAVIFDRWGRLDGLAACAGVLGELTPTFQARPRMVEEVMSVNFTANQRLIRAMDPLLRAAPAGRAVFVSSGVARNPRAFWGVYAASKAALETLVACYAAEVAITNVRVNTVNPGPTRTAMRAKAFPGEDPDTLPAPEEVAPMFVDLLSPDCARHGELVTYKR